MAKISVIIPVYNAEAGLSRLFESIKNQTFTDLEILFIDDGSTDHSSLLLDRFAREDHRVKVIHQQNQGVSAARNKGLDLAQGKYIRFLDSDDWIPSYSMEILLQAIEENHCDMAVGPFYRVSGNSVHIKGDEPDTGVMSRQDYASNMMEAPADFYYGVLWNKLYRSDIIRQHHLRMDTDFSWCEDFLFNLSFIRCATRFIAVNKPVYYYVKTKGSLVAQSTNPIRAMRIKTALFEYYNEFCKEIYTDQEYASRMARIYTFIVQAASDTDLSKKAEEDLKTPVYSNIYTSRSDVLNLYRLRILTKQALARVARQCSLNNTDVLVYTVLQEVPVFESRSEIAEYANISLASTSLALERLQNMRMIRIEEAGNQLKTIFLPESGQLDHCLSQERSKIREQLFQGFADEEKAQFTDLENKMRDNLRKAMLK